MLLEKIKGFFHLSWHEQDYLFTKIGTILVGVGVITGTFFTGYPSVHFLGDLLVFQIAKSLFLGSLIGNLIIIVRYVGALREDPKATWLTEPPRASYVEFQAIALIFLIGIFPLGLGTLKEGVYIKDCGEAIAGSLILLLLAVSHYKCLKLRNSISKTLDDNLDTKYEEIKTRLGGNECLK